MTQKLRQTRSKPSARQEKGSLAVDWQASESFKVPMPRNEPERLEELKALEILDTPPEDQFDHLTRLASAICGTPIAMISLVDEDRQWFKSKVGLRSSETPREHAFCAHAIVKPNPFIVPDAQKDPRFVNNPLVTSNPKIRFYAGAPLMTPQKRALGTLCVIDRVPRKLSSDQIKALEAIRDQVMVQLVLRQQMRQMERALLEHERLERVLNKEIHSLRKSNRSYQQTIRRMSHAARGQLERVQSVLDLVRSGVTAPLDKRLMDELKVTVGRVADQDRDLLRLAAMERPIRYGRAQMDWRTTAERSYPQ